jgi:hypothetical protein
MSSATSSDDARITGRMGDLFSSVKGPPKVEAGARPPATPPPPPPPGAPAAVPAAPPVDLAPHLRRLDAQLASVLAAVQALDQRLAKIEAKTDEAAKTGHELDERFEEIGKALFDWFEAFSQWQNDRFDRIDRMAAGRSRPS